jgi:dihydrofolate reductase
VGEITVTMWTSIDGYVAGPEGEIDWILGDEQLAAYELAAVTDRDTLLLGRSTYEDFAGYWPVAASSPDQGFERDQGRNMTAMRKVVASSTLTDPEWTGTEVIRSLDSVPPTQAGEHEGNPHLRQPQPGAPAD